MLTVVATKTNGTFATGQFFSGQFDTPRTLNQIHSSLFGAACILFKVVLYTIHKITKQSKKSYEKRKEEALRAAGPRKGPNGFDNAAFTLDNGHSPETSQDRLHNKLWLTVGSDANLRQKYKR